MNTREKIKNTKIYQGLEFYRKKIVLKRNNVKAIEHSLEVIKNIGFDQWEKQTQSNYLNRLIINEIKNNERE